jgi:hypothetical protein
MSSVEAVLGLVWSVLNSPAGIAALAGIILWALNRLYAAKPAWAQYEGAIISAVRFAEKEIPDDVSNKGMARLDQALKYVLRVFYEVNRREPTRAEAMALRDGIQIIHNDLDAQGVLK